MPPFNFFQDIYQNYQNHQFCDLALYGSLATPQNQPIWVHKLVVCSLFPGWLSFVQEETDHVTLPDIEHAHLQRFVDQVYQGLTHEVHSWQNLDPEMADFFQIHHAFTPKCKNTLHQLLSPEIELKTENGQSTPDFLEPNAINLFHEISADDGEEDMDEADSRNDHDDEWKHSLDEEDHSLDDGNLEGNPFKSADGTKRTTRSKGVKRKVSRSSWREQSVKRKAALVPPPTDTGPEIDHAAIINLLQSQGQGILPVNVTSSPVTSFKGARYDKSVCTEGCLFLALIGVRVREETIYGKSLAWTTDDPEAIGGSFSPTLLACHEIFGLPRAQLLGSGCFRTFVETGQQSKNPNYVNDLHRKYMYQCTRENLFEEQNHPEVVNANAATKPTRIAIDPPPTDYSIQMTSDLRHFEDILLVGVYKRQVEVRQISFNNNRHEFQASTCSRLLTLVWVGGNLKAKFPRSKLVTEVNKENTRLRYTKTFTDKLLASDEVLPKPLPLLTCEFCGKQIQENIFMNNMIQHMQIHKLQKFQCKCNLKFESLEEKQKHYEETHSELFRKQKKPRRQTQPKHICEICGKVICSKQYLKLHVLRSHQKYFCQHCEKYFDSALVFETHWAQVHPGMKMEMTQGEFSCDQCPKRFRHKLYLQRHWTLNHGTEEDKPHKCGLCTKTFSEKLKLSQHVLCIHINNRPYVCRSLNCTSSFNSQGNLYVHEKKHHGRVMGKATTITTLVPDSLLLEMGCELGKNPPGRPKRRVQW